MLKLIDVSRWNGPGSVPWDEVDGGFVRLTYGLHVDFCAEEHLWRGRKAGKLLGGYGWLDCSIGVWGGEQAELLLATAAKLSPVQLALAVDVEPAKPERPDPPTRTRAQLNSFLSASRGRRVVAAYLNFSEALRIDLAGNPSIVEGCPLWLADWTPPYEVPKPWDRWTILQTGKKGGVDRDVFEGSAEDFRRTFGLCADHPSSMRGDR